LVWRAGGWRPMGPRLGQTCAFCGAPSGCHRGGWFAAA